MSMGVSVITHQHFHSHPMETTIPDSYPTKAVAPKIELAASAGVVKAVRWERWDRSGGSGKVGVMGAVGLERWGGSGRMGTVGWERWYGSCGSGGMGAV